MLDVADLAKRLIAAPSITPATGSVFDVLEAMLAPLGFAVHRFTRGQGPEGSDEAPVALAAVLALVLVGLGVQSLSMAPSKVPMVRFALSLHSLAECQGIAATALAARTAREAMQAVQGVVHDDLRALV